MNDNSSKLIHSHFLSENIATNGIKNYLIKLGFYYYFIYIKTIRSTKIRLLNLLTK